MSKKDVLFVIMISLTIFFIVEIGIMQKKYNNIKTDFQLSNQENKELRAKLNPLATFTVDAIFRRPERPDSCNVWISSGNYQEHQIKGKTKDFFINQQLILIKK